jgi:hypothetical protein
MQWRLIPSEMLAGIQASDDLARWTCRLRGPGATCKVENAKEHTHVVHHVVHVVHIYGKVCGVGVEL